jgi:hypothetical protein
MENLAKRFLKIHAELKKLRLEENGGGDQRVMAELHARRHALEVERASLDKKMDSLAERHLKQRLKENPKEWALIVEQEAAVRDEAIKALAKGAFLLEQVRHADADEIREQIWPHGHTSREKLRDLKKFNEELDRLRSETLEPLYLKKSRLFQERLSLDNPSIWEHFKTRYIKKALAAAKISD